MHLDLAHLEKQHLHHLSEHEHFQLLELFLGLSVRLKNLGAKAMQA